MRHHMNLLHMVSIFDSVSMVSSLGIKGRLLNDQKSSCSYNKLHIHPAHHFTTPQQNTKKRFIIFKLNLLELWQKSSGIHLTIFGTNRAVEQKQKGPGSVALVVDLTG